MKDDSKLKQLEELYKIILEKGSINVNYIHHINVVKKELYLKELQDIKNIN